MKRKILNILRTFLSLAEINSHMFWERLIHEIYYSFIPNNHKLKGDCYQVLKSLSCKDLAIFHT